MSKQKGYVFRAGEFWWLRFFESKVEGGKVVRKQRAKKLCRILAEHKRLKRPPEYVEQLQKKFLAKVNQGDAAPEMHITLNDFFTNVFLPHMKGRRKQSTCYCQLTNWRKHFVARIGDIRVRDFGTVDAQKTLDWIARDHPTLARQTLFRLKSLLSAVFRHAVNQGYHGGPSPVSLAEVPGGRQSKIMPHCSYETVQKLLMVLPEPARTVVAIAAFAGLRKGEIEGLRWEDIGPDSAFAGLRKGEIEGLRWEDIGPDSIRVARSIWAGKAHDTKTAASKGLVPLIPALRLILEAHHLRAGNPSTGPLFPTSKSTPVSLNNILNDQILPTLRRCVHCGKAYDKPHIGHEYKRDESRPDWTGFHSFRRGLATSLNSLGVEDLTIQKILRHSNVEITRRAYIRTLPAQTTEAMGRLQGKLTSMIQ